MSLVDEILDRVDPKILEEDDNKLYIPDDIRFVGHSTLRDVVADDTRIKIFESFDYVYTTKTTNALAHFADQGLLGKTGVIKKHMQALEKAYILERIPRAPGFSLTSFGWVFKQGLDELKTKTKPHFSYVLSEDPTATPDDSGFDIAHNTIESRWIQDLRLLANGNRWVVAQRLAFNDQPLSARELADSLPKVPPAAFRSSLLSLQGRIVVDQDGRFTATPYAQDLIIGLVTLGIDTYEEFIKGLYRKAGFGEVPDKETIMKIKGIIVPAPDRLLEPTHFGTGSTAQLATV